MDAITQFQESLAEPVYGFIGDYWPFLVVVAIALGGWFLTPRWRDRNGVYIDMTTDGDRSSDNDGSGDGESGGGDGGGGGD